MKPTMEILARISRNSLANKDEIFTKLYRYLLRPDVFYVAYKKLYANNRAATKGVNNDTADGFSEAKIANIIKSLVDETFQPTPVRRTHIEKKNDPKKKRPLGIPTFTDKLVQEVLRMVLEAVYEPIFLTVSHGFRPKRSCHTALTSLKKEFNGARWFVEGDIKGCFDNINHAVLVGLKAKVCELCGTTESDHYEIHHVNKLKNLKGKQLWEKVMIAKRRKTLILCRKCHYEIHN